VSTPISDTALLNSGTATVTLGAHFGGGSGALTFTATSGDTAVATVSVSSATLTVTAAASGTGTSAVTVTATDTAGNTASDSFDVVVYVLPSVSTAIADVSIATSGTTLVALGDHFTGGAGSLSYTASSSDTTVTTVSVSGASLTVTAAASGTGTATVTVTASDTAGNSVSDSFGVEVTESTWEPSPVPVTVPDVSWRWPDDAQISVTLKNFAGKPSYDPSSVDAGGGTWTVTPWNQITEDSIREMIFSRSGYEDITLSWSINNSAISAEVLDLNATQLTVSTPINDVSLVNSATATVALGDHFSGGNGELTYTTASDDTSVDHRHQWCDFDGDSSLVWHRHRHGDGYCD